MNEIITSKPIALPITMGFWVTIPRILNVFKVQHFSMKSMRNSKTSDCKTNNKSGISKIPPCRMRIKVTNSVQAWVSGSRKGIQRIRTRRLVNVTLAKIAKQRIYTNLQLSFSFFQERYIASRTPCKKPHIKNPVWGPCQSPAMLITKTRFKMILT